MSCQFLFQLADHKCKAAEFDVMVYIALHTSCVLQVGKKISASVMNGLKFNFKLMFFVIVNLSIQFDSIL